MGHHPTPRVEYVLEVPALVASDRVAVGACIGNLVMKSGDIEIMQSSTAALYLCRCIFALMQGMETVLTATSAVLRCHPTMAEKSTSAPLS